MRYYRIYDDISPEGQYYRVTEDDRLEVYSVDKTWVESAYTMIFGPVGALMFFNLNESQEGTVIVEVEAPE